LLQLKSLVVVLFNPLNQSITHDITTTLWVLIPADVRGDLAPLSGSAAGSRLEEEKEVCQGMERADRILL